MSSLLYRARRRKATLISTFPNNWLRGKGSFIQTNGVENMGYTLCLLAPNGFVSIMTLKVDDDFIAILKHGLFRIVCGV